MKVLIIDHFLPGSVYSKEIGRELAKHCELSMLCNRETKVEDDGIRYIPKLVTGGRNKIESLLFYFISLFCMFKEITFGKYDVVHIQGTKRDDVEFRLYGIIKRTKKKLVYTVHNVMPHEQGGKMMGIYNSFYKSCDALIVHNELTKKILLENFDAAEDKVYITSHGTYEMYKDSIIERKPDGVKRFLQFGFIRQYKGVDILIEAVNLIPAEKRKNLRFEIMGKQYEKLDPTDYAGMIRKYGLEDCVELKNERVPDEMMPELMSRTDFLLFPYRHIYGSGALLMAYTFGKPVLVSRLPALIEETENGQTGFVFENEDPKDLAWAIMAAADCSEEELTRYRRKIEELARTKYSWAVSGKKTAEIYETLLQ